MRLHRAKPVVETMWFGETTCERAIGGATLQRLGETRRVDWRGRRSLAKNFGRNALRDLADIAAVAKQEESSRLSLDVNKAWCNDEPRRVDSLLRRHVMKGAPLRDPGDALAAEGHVAIKPSRACSVDDAAILYDQIIRAAGIHGRCSPGSHSAGDEQ